ncbi:c-type cytochrome domain-containing protein [Stieleria varia]|uniref:Chromosome partition protein Smc n=1 Tax=Stieleria varia TaxID=2528005 RepID=A0A5C6B3X8_9BACT|nr:c-type cytochrome domain-containing protein [Stieleria varia]TWU05986.1 Chromosome partition protein Smc [Stieleria varia]
MRHYQTLSLVFAFVGSVFSSVLVAEDQKSPEGEVKKVTYEDDVKPILRQHCLNCHHQGDKKGGLALDTFTALMEGGGSGEIVYDDGDAEASRMWQLVNHDDTPVMPPEKDKLPAEQLAVIRAWIEGGVLENSGSKAKAKKKNALAFTSSAGGKPEGPAAMPETIPQSVPVVTERAAAITALAASPWAPLIAIAGQKQIVMYHTDTNELLGILPYPDGIAQSLRFSRDGSYLIVGGGEHSFKGTAVIFNVKTGERVAEIGDELDTVFDADVNDKMNRVAMGGPLKMLRIFDATDGEKLFDIKKHTDWIYSVAYSPDGVLIASGDRSGGLCVWEAETGRLYLDLVGHKDAVRSLSWRDDSNVLASASLDGSVKLWDVNSGNVVKSIDAHGGGATAVSFDHQGRVATAGKDDRAKLWDPSGNLIKEFRAGSEDVLEVVITHDGKRVIYGDWNGDVLTANAENPDEKQNLAANPPPIEARIESVKTTLASVQQELQPAKAAWDAAQAAVAAAQKPVDELNAQIAALQKQSADADAAAKANDAKRAAIDGELGPLTATSRELQDALIVAQVNLKKDANLLDQMAVAEEALAKHLLALAGKRRERIGAVAAVGQQQQLAAAKKAEADKLAATLPPLQQKVAEATAAANQAKAAHDAIAARVNAIQDKMNRMLAEK